MDELLCKIKAAYDYTSVDSIYIWYLIYNMHYPMLSASLYLWALPVIFIVNANRPVNRNYKFFELLEYKLYLKVLWRKLNSLKKKKIFSPPRCFCLRFVKLHCQNASELLGYLIWIKMPAKRSKGETLSVWNNFIYILFDKKSELEGTYSMISMMRFKKSSTSWWNLFSETLMFKEQQHNLFT